MGYDQGSKWRRVRHLRHLDNRAVSKTRSTHVWVMSLAIRPFARSGSCWPGSSRGSTATARFSAGTV